VGAVVLDSSVVIALFDTDDLHHAAAADLVRRRRRGGSAWLLPTSVLAEVLVGAHRQGRETVALRRRQLRDAFGVSRVIDEEVAEAAAELRAQHRSLRLPDALVVAVAVVDHAEEVLTADKRLAGVDERVLVVEGVSRGS
jgi:predicted nucleic acid-binding protein